MDLHYAPSVAPSTIRRLEEAARAVGITLGDLELLGQDASTAERFVQAVLDGNHAAALETTDWAALEDALQRRGTTEPYQPPGVAPA